MVGNCPVQWVSKFQTEIAISTMEAEYTVLSTAMHDLILHWTLMDEGKELLGTTSLPSHILQNLPCFYNKRVNK